MSPIKGVSELRRIPRLGKIRLGIKEISPRTSPGVQSPLCGGLGRESTGYQSEPSRENQGTSEPSTTRNPWERSEPMKKSNPVYQSEPAEESNPDVASEPEGLPAPEQRLLKLLEEGISMGKFNAVKAQREVWDAGDRRIKI